MAKHKHVTSNAGRSQSFSCLHGTVCLCVKASLRNSCRACLPHDARPQEFFSNRSKSSATDQIGGRSIAESISNQKTGQDRFSFTSCNKNDQTGYCVVRMTVPATAHVSSTQNEHIIFQSKTLNQVVQGRETRNGRKQSACDMI